MTLYTAKMKAKDRNEVIASTLASDYNCKEAVKFGKFNNKPEFVLKVKPMIKGK